MKIDDLRTALDLADRYQRLNAAVAALHQEVARKSEATYPISLPVGATLYLTADNLLGYATERLRAMERQLHGMGVDLS